MLNAEWRIENWTSAGSAFLLSALWVPPTFCCERLAIHSCPAAAGDGFARLHRTRDRWRVSPAEARDSFLLLNSTFSIQHSVLTSVRRPHFGQKRHGCQPPRLPSDFCHFCCESLLRKYWRFTLVPLPRDGVSRLHRTRDGGRVSPAEARDSFLLLNSTLSIQHSVLTPVRRPHLGQRRRGHRPITSAFCPIPSAPKTGIDLAISITTK